MRRGTRKSLWGLALVMALSGYGAGVQAQAEEPSAQETGDTLDQEAGTPAGAQRVTERLTTEFGVETSKIQGLRDQQLGYGEIHHALTLTRQMPGGLTDENLQQVMKMRKEEGLGWGQIAQRLGGKLGQIKHAPGEPPTTTTETPSLMRSGSSPGSRKGAGRGGDAMSTQGAGSGSTGSHVHGKPFGGGGAGGIGGAKGVRKGAGKP